MLVVSNRALINYQIWDDHDDHPKSGNESPRFSWFKSKLITGVAYGCLKGLYMIENWLDGQKKMLLMIMIPYDPQIHSDLTVSNGQCCEDASACLPEGAHPVIPEVKYVCLCAALGWPHAVHVYDPVDWPWAMLRKLSSRADPQNMQFDGGFHGHHFFDPFLGTQKQWKWRTSSGCQRTSASWMLRPDSIVSHLAWHRWTTKSHLHQPMYPIMSNIEIFGRGIVLSWLLQGLILWFSMTYECMAYIFLRQIPMKLA